MRHILYKSLIIIFLIVTLIIPPLLYIHTDHFNKFLKNALSEAVNSSINQKFTVGSIELNIPSDVTLRDIQLTIDGKNFVKVDYISLQSPISTLLSFFLSGNISLQKTHIKGAEVTLTRSETGVWNFRKIKKTKKNEKKKERNIYLINSTISNSKLTIDDSFRDRYLKFLFYDSRFTLDLIGIKKKFILAADDLNVDFNKIGGLKARKLKVDARITKHDLYFENLDGFINGIDIQGKGTVANFKSPDFTTDIFVSNYKPSGIGVFNAEIKSQGKIHKLNNIEAKAEVKLVDSTLREKHVWTSLKNIHMKGTKIEIDGDLNSEFGKSSIDGFVDIKRLLTKKGLNRYYFQLNLANLSVKDLQEVITRESKFLNINDNFNSDAMFTVSGSWSKKSDFIADFDINRLNLQLDENNFLIAGGKISAFSDRLTFSLQTKSDNFPISTFLNLELGGNSVFLNSELNISGDIPYKNSKSKMGISVSGNFDNSRINGFSVIKGIINSKYEDQTLKLTSLDISSNFFSLHVQNQGSKNGDMDLAFSAESDDLTFLNFYYKPLKTEGSVKIDGTLKGNRKNPKISFDAEVKDLNYADEFYFDKGKIKLVTELRENKLFSLGLSSYLKEIRYRKMHLTDLELIAKTSTKDLEVKINGKTSNKSIVKSDFTVYNFTGKNKKIEIDKLILNHGNQFLHNTKNLTVSLTPDNIYLDSFLLKNGQSELYADGFLNYNGGNSNLKLKVKDLNCSLISGIILNDLSIDGIINLELKLKGQIHNPLLELVVISKNFRINRLKPYNLKVKVVGSKNKTTFDLQEKSNIDGNYSIANGVIHAPINFYNTDRIMNSKLNMKLQLNNLNIDLLIALNPKIKELYGNLTTQIDISGTLLNPVLNGTARLNQIGISVLPLENMLILNSAEINFQNNLVTLPKTEITSKNGKAEILGNATLDDLKYRAQIRLSDLYIKHPIFDTKLAGEFTLTGEKKRMKANGKLNLNNLSVEVKNQQGTGEKGEIIFMDDDEVKYKTTDVKAINTNKNGNYYKDNFAANLELSIPNDTWVSNANAKIAIKGNLFIQKEYGVDNIISGTISSNKGNYKAFGKLFKVKKGLINFPSITDFNPQIDVTASYEIQNIDILVNIIGTAKEPRINLTSSPPLSKENLISYLIFGTSNTKLGSDQRNVTQEIASNIAMVEFKESILPKLGLNIVDVLSIQGSEDSGFSRPQIKVGSFINDKFYLGYERNFSVITNNLQEQIKVEYSISNSFLVDSIIGGENTGADIFYHFDF